LTFFINRFIILIIKNKQGGTKMQVTKKSIIGDVLDNAPATAQFFFEIGMHCLGCPSARGESIEQACAVHGTDADALVEKINAFLAAEK
jgi:hybrid cluster-associated redox disulfide protein